ncbi:MAG: YgiT-type zinc finger protein [Ignavibacteriae bacterium]|nr:YgiT-type zinc finger protein [Ignavibacteriota bacterium]
MGERAKRSEKYALCHVCGSTEFSHSVLREAFEIERKHLLVKNIPAEICSRCGERIFSRETTEKVRLIVHGKTKPVKSVSMDVFAY